jgi:hypothetical protein
MKFSLVVIDLMILLLAISVSTSSVINQVG